MSTTETLPIIDKHNYYRIYELLTCNDEGSKNLAFSLLESVDFKQSELYIYCLLNQMSKKVVNFSSLFENKLPDLAKKIREDLTNNKMLDGSKLNISFRKLYEITLEKEDNEEDLLFLINLFSEELKTILVEYGFSFLEYFDIVVKPKKHE